MPQLVSLLERTRSELDNFEVTFNSLEGCRIEQNRMKIMDISFHECRDVIIGAGEQKYMHHFCAHVGASLKL